MSDNIPVDAAAAAAATEQTAAAAAEQAAAAATTEQVTADPPTGLHSLPFKERYFGARDEIPVFEGKQSYTAEAFHTKVLFACDTYAITIPTDRVRIAMSRLEGDASKFQVDLAQTGELPASLEELFNKLKSRYPVSPEETAAYLLLHKVSLQGNQMAKYLQEFNRQVSRLGPGEAGLQQLLQELFLSGVPLGLRQAVDHSRPEMGWTNLEALESAAAKAQQTSDLGKAASGSSHESGKRGGASAHDQPNKRSRFNKGSGSGSGGPGASTYCEHCKRPGHDTKFCRKLKALQAGSSKPKN